MKLKDFLIRICNNQIEWCNQEIMSKEELEINGLSEDYNKGFLVMKEKLKQIKKNYKNIIEEVKE